MSVICITSARFLESTGYFDEHQFAIHVFAFAEVVDFDDVGQLVELFDDLFQRGVVAARDDGHARGGGVLRRGDVERVDVVATAAEQSGHARQHAEFVLHQH